MASPVLRRSTRVNLVGPPEDEESKDDVPDLIIVSERRQSLRSAVPPKTEPTDDPVILPPPTNLTTNSASKAPVTKTPARPISKSQCQSKHQRRALSDARIARKLNWNMRRSTSGKRVGDAVRSIRLLTGQWPWEYLKGFLPKKWGITMLEDMRRLLRSVCKSARINGPGPHTKITRDFLFGCAKKRDAEDPALSLCDILDAIDHFSADFYTKGQGMSVKASKTPPVKPLSRGIVIPETDDENSETDSEGDVHLGSDSEWEDWTGYNFDDDDIEVISQREIQTTGPGQTTTASIPAQITASTKTLATVQKEDQATGRIEVPNSTATTGHDEVQATGQEEVNVVLKRSRSPSLPILPQKRPRPSLNVACDDTSNNDAIAWDTTPPPTNLCNCNHNTVPQDTAPLSQSQTFTSIERSRSWTDILEDFEFLESEKRKELDAVTHSLHEVTTSIEASETGDTKLGSEAVDKLCDDVKAYEAEREKIIKGKHFVEQHHEDMAMSADDLANAVQKYTVRLEECDALIAEANSQVLEELETIAQKDSDLRAEEKALKARGKTVLQEVEYSRAVRMMMRLGPEGMAVLLARLEARNIGLFGMAEDIMIERGIASVDEMEDGR
ncbi:hypothetical protein NW768_007833 [Fusarium equiseti]|uniref:Uncharacterized protein n=1 Tax=Fusarium equiseti TaxID=61235 RepID=A0ABQ8R8S1_FUSEQ|nr:hypothetical protein NW768_007833 [Fusarium equiseti]